jgi:adenylate kinase
MAVCSRRQAQTEQKRDEEKCTLIDEILVRTVVFLGAFAELRKATISIVMRARLSVRMEHFGYFLEIWHFTIFENMQ